MIVSLEKNKDNIIKHIIKNLKKDLNIYIKIIILILHQKMILLLVFLLTTARVGGPFQVHAHREITIFLQTFFGNFPIFPNSLEKFGKIG